MVLGIEQSTGESNPISQKFLDKVDTLALERNQRILDAEPRIPGLLWTGLLFGGVVLVTLGGFMRLGNERAHLLLRARSPSCSAYCCSSFSGSTILSATSWASHPNLLSNPSPFSTRSTVGRDQAQASRCATILSTSARRDSISQYACITAKMNAVLMPNRSTPFTASSAPSIRNRDGSTNPGVSNVVDGAERVKRRFGERTKRVEPLICRRPERRFAGGEVRPKISATAPMWPITIGIARRGSCKCSSIPTRILLCRPNASITTPVVWIAMVSTMSDRPKAPAGQDPSVLLPPATMTFAANCRNYAATGCLGRRIPRTEN